ncbi:hypothetical protein DPSP01_006852 [Paraphaeosphaeria sporulosa]|uniref:CFEM domain-containing protein n=1 Tax=Paraphaeosphaeria sporulosa TaxID=1460663 RepID=A0A177CLP6_9PLEO|nr:uncharacterized protein CC84DRAFT_1162403 [Paraphaeosphaeria sporulosa]OAG08455.1 hypothetical protein CC84DRAFT_1162403 [Paraphaeosphaeria sporulosa]
MKASIALLISGLAAQQVAAHWDRQATNYNTPGYNNNECTDKQKGGYDWSDLNDGDKPGKYDDFDFGGGWSCSTKKFGKRDHITKRTFGAKALTNSCGKEKPASFSCDKKDGFSVTHMDISVDHDAELDFHYKMKDGSICKQRTSCKKEGTTVQNTQCGGAQSVDVYLGNSSEGKDSCDIGVHNVGFDCNPGQSYTPPPPYTPPTTPEAPPSTSSEVPSSSSEVPPPPPETTAPPQTSDSPPPPPESSSVSIRTPFCGYGSCGSSSSFTNSSTAPPTPPETPSSTPVEVPSSSTEVPTSSAPSGECGGYGQPACETSSAVESTPAESSSVVESTPVSSAPASSTPSGECGGYGQPACETSSVVESTPVSSAPATETAPTETAPATSYNGTVPSSPVSSQPPTVTPPPGGYTPPECLPKCLNTWLKLKSECKDNTDSACYCKVPDLTDNVIDCVKAYGTEEEVKQALSYFVGICAPQIPENPHIIDKCTDVPLAPPTAPVTSAPETPATTAAPEQPQTPGTTPAPAPEQPGSIPCTTITYGSSTYTVPQVGFTTETPGAPGANPTEPIALYPAAPTTPAPAPANPTAPYPIASGASGFTSVTFPTGTGAINSPPPSEFSGAANALNVKAGMVFGAAFAFFAM